MLSNTWKIYLLALISFLVGTSEYVIAGILDKIAEDIGVSVSAANGSSPSSRLLTRLAPLF